jgi:hypothetical protein
MVAVAILAIILVAFAEESRRWMQREFHARQERYCEQQAAAFFDQGKVADATGRKQVAAQSFAAVNYWNERAHGHHVMVRGNQSWVWLLRR